MNMILLHSNPSNEVISV